MSIRKKRKMLEMNKMCEMTVRIAAEMSEGHGDASTSAEKFCVNDMPWKLVPQTMEDYDEFQFVDKLENRVSDVESFVWKWSPCGRYGMDLPGGRDVINQQLRDQMAMFDLHTNTWTLYAMTSVHFEIPRACFLYWAGNNIIVIVSLAQDYDEPGPDEDVFMFFKQSFYYVCHDTQTLEHAGTCKYRTEKTIVASYWYHIFENRRGEPFIDDENELWVVFSNGKDALILLPYIPTLSSYRAKWVSFDMDRIVSELIGARVYLDPFVSSHFVPWVYRDDINFFIRIDAYSFDEHGPDGPEADASCADKYGTYQLRVNLKSVLAKADKDTEPRFCRKDVELWRKVAGDCREEHETITQHGKHVVLMRWSHFTIDMASSKSFGTRIAEIDSRNNCCTKRTGDFAYCTIDLDTEKMRKFDTLIVGTDVIVPHPSGSLFMFRYKEDYAMRICELPYFPPLSLKLKCFQSLYGCVEIDPNYYKKKCSLKENPKDNEQNSEKSEKLSTF